MEMLSVLLQFCASLSRWDYLFLGRVFQVKVWHWLCRTQFLPCFPAFVYPLVFFSGCNCTELTELQDRFFSLDSCTKHIILCGIEVVQIFFTKFHLFQFFSTDLHSLYSKFSVQLNFNFFFWT